MKSRSWHDWYEAQSDMDAVHCKLRLTHGEAGNPENPTLACQHSYDAGICEGERRAAERLAKLLRGERP